MSLSGDIRCGLSADEWSLLIWFACPVCLSAKTLWLIDVAQWKYKHFPPRLLWFGLVCVHVYVPACVHWSRDREGGGVHTLFVSFLCLFWEGMCVSVCEWVLVRVYALVLIAHSTISAFKFVLGQWMSLTAYLEAHILNRKQFCCCVLLRVLFGKLEKSWIFCFSH